MLLTNAPRDAWLGDANLLSVTGVSSRFDADKNVMYINFTDIHLP